MDRNRAKAEGLAGTASKAAPFHECDRRYLDIYLDSNLFDISNIFTKSNHFTTPVYYFRFFALALLVWNAKTHQYRLLETIKKQFTVPQINNELISPTHTLYIIIPHDLRRNIVSTGTPKK